MKEKKYPGKALGAILIVLLLMPLGHALMILMEHFLTPAALHYSAFAMGFMGLVITIWGVFVGQRIFPVGMMGKALAHIRHIE